MARFQQRRKGVCNDNQRISILLTPTAFGFKVLISGDRTLDLLGQAHVLKANARGLMRERGFKGMDERVSSLSQIWDPPVTECPTGYEFDAIAKPGWPTALFRHAIKDAAEHCIRNVLGAVIDRSVA